MYYIQKSNQYFFQCVQEHSLHTHKYLSFDNAKFHLLSYFTNTHLKNIDYKHSTQGKGSNKLKEILLTCTH